MWCFLKSFKSDVLLLPSYKPSHGGLTGYVSLKCHGDSYVSLGLSTEEVRLIQKPAPVSQGGTGVSHLSYSEVEVKWSQTQGVSDP